APSAPLVPEGGTAAPPEGVALLSGDHVIELDRLRVRIADNMLRAKQSAAHVWASIEVDYENVERVRQAHREEWKKTEGFSLTYLPFIARATVDALAAFPVVNSSIYPEQGKAVFHTSINLGIAVDLDQKGLLVATVRGADGLRVVGLARAIRSVAEKARDKALQPDDVTGSTFSITNPGPFGSFLTAPIINVPNTAILSTDTVSKRPVVVTDAYGNDSISIRHIGYLGFSWDHRAFDGSTAVLFLQRLKQSLETWDWEQELA
ncbi:MAG: 2-oxo acid dehydrogenase subunit E2, partial [Acidimicrobiia bacterium]